MADARRASPAGKYDASATRQYARSNNAETQSVTLRSRDPALVMWMATEDNAVSNTGTSGRGRSGVMASV